MQKKILFIGHDANYAGAQYLLLHLLTYLKSVESVKTMLLLGNSGGLFEEYSKVTEVVFWQNGDIAEKDNNYFTFQALNFKISSNLRFVEILYTLKLNHVGKASNNAFSQTYV